MNSSPIGVSLSGTPAIHPTRLSGEKLGMAVFSAMAGQLSVAAAITPAMRLRDLLGDLPRDLACVMWFIGASSVGDCAATRLWPAFYRKQGGRRHGFDDTMRPCAWVPIVALRCKSWSTKTLRRA